MFKIHNKTLGQCVDLVVNNENTRVITNDIALVLFVSLGTKLTPSEPTTGFPYS